jgi:hypothetical protein
MDAKLICQTVRVAGHTYIKAEEHGKKREMTKSS